MTLETYGTSLRGKPEYVLTVSNKASTTPKPELMITAATHGNETATVAQMMLSSWVVMLEGSLS